jgi:CheY-like chemotaxis protein
VKEPTTVPDSKRLRVLVVDDQEAVCEVVAETIRYAGHDVIGTARDGVEAIERAEQLRPDVVIMDVAMPRKNGVEAMKTILETRTAGRVALMSGEYRSLGLTQQEMMRNGAAAFLEKPFNVDQLFDLLAQWSQA